MLNSDVSTYKASRKVTTDYSVPYRSSRQPELTLYTDVYLPPTPAPLLLTLHNWHGDRTSNRQLAELLGQHYVVVNPDMRGRGSSMGTPDVNGWELLDAVDAVNHVRKSYAPYISNCNSVYCLGSGGGGGNVYALLAKFPDCFAAGIVLNGVSDYALWYKANVTGEFRDEMLAWIGCDPYENLSAYQARSGLHLLENVNSPILIIHGVEDTQVPLSMARLYYRRAAQLHKDAHCVEVDYAGHKLKIEQFLDQILAFTGKHSTVIAHPQSGVWRIGGYLQTGSHRVELESLNSFEKIKYQLDAQHNLILQTTQLEQLLPKAKIVSLA